jgi:hypothetical protein
MEVDIDNVKNSEFKLTNTAFVTFNYENYA